MLKPRKKVVKEWTRVFCGIR